MKLSLFYGLSHSLPRTLLKYTFRRSIPGNELNVSALLPLTRIPPHPPNAHARHDREVIREESTRSWKQPSRIIRDMLGVYSKEHIVIPHHSCTVKRVNDPKLPATLRVLSIFDVVIVSRTVNDVFSRGLVSAASSSSLPLVPILHAHLVHPRISVPFPRRAHHLTRTGGEQCMA